jgi:hypothetical protein
MGIMCNANRDTPRWFALITADNSMTDDEYAALLERLTPKPAARPPVHPKYRDEKSIADMSPGELFRLGRELGTLGYRHDAMRWRLRP